MDRATNWENKMSDFLFDSNHENISAASVSSSAGNNLLQRDTNQTTDSSNRGSRKNYNFKACLPHNLYKSSSSNNNKASCSSSNSRVGPINPRTISESPATNSSLRNVLARQQIHQGFNHENLEPSRNHNSGSRAGQSCSFPLLPHEMLTWHNRRRLSEEATRGTHEYDSFVPSPFGPSSSADEVGTTSLVGRSSVLAMDAPGGGGNGQDVLSAVEGRQRLDYILNDPFEIENGFVEFRDPHRDMRLDVDNMSYEELLDLEERIGNVSSGLNKSYIRGSIRQRKFEAIRASLNLEPCSICREDYVDGANIGKLYCGHEFHTHCIQQWLILKNICPICKMTAIET